MHYEREIFVFGSNEAGRHGAGAAKFAVLNHGAKIGKGYGMQGNAFAIPTKDKNLKTLPIDEIEEYVDSFLRFATFRPDYKFNVTKVGCGLAGLPESVIAPMFKHATKNVYLPQSFVELLARLGSHHPISFDLNDKPVEEV